jgi:hypothetical protein
MSKNIGLFTVNEVCDAVVGQKVTYLGKKWKVIEILPHGSRVLYRPFYKIFRTGVLIV